MVKVLVTGGAGFIGSHLVERCLQKGYQTTVVDNLMTGSLSNLKDCLAHIELLEGSVEEISTLPIDLNEYDIIFHLAASAYVPPSVENPLYDYRSNLWSTFVLLEELRKLSKIPALIYASSAAVYGDPLKIPITEKELTVPVSPYGVSKLAAERYINVYARLYGIRATSLRLFSVYGPRQRKQVIYDLMKKLINDPSHLSVIGDGSQQRDFVFVEDVVNAFFAAWDNSSLHGDVYNVASGHHVSIEQLVQILCQVSNLNPKIEFSGSTRLGDAERWIVDITKLKTLGCVPSVTLNIGLERTYQWLCLQLNY